MFTKCNIVNLLKSYYSSTIQQIKETNAGIYTFKFKISGYEFMI